MWLTLCDRGHRLRRAILGLYLRLGSTLADVTRVSGPRPRHSAFATFGVGLTAGNLFIPRFADRALMKTAGGLLIWSAVVLALYPLAARGYMPRCWPMCSRSASGRRSCHGTANAPDGCRWRCTGATAALNHSAFNIANALGPWLGGMAIAAGFGLTSTGYVGCGLALGGSCGSGDRARRGGAPRRRCHRGLCKRRTTRIDVFALYEGPLHRGMLAIRDWRAADRLRPRPLPPCPFPKDIR